MSKGFNMTGWRLGFVVGNPLIVKAYADVKDNSDSGQFLAIQQACAYALDHPEITQKIAAKYSRRMDGLVNVLNKHGFGARKPKGSFFLYVRAPKAAVGKEGKRVAFENAEADRIMVDYRREFDEAKRIELYRRLQEIIHDEAPYVFLFMDKTISVVDRRFRDTNWYPTGGPNTGEWWVPPTLQRYG